MKIAIDVMGGDFAPVETVKGALDGAREYGIDLILVGQESKIHDELSKHTIKDLSIDILHTDEWLIEGEHPAYALRQKRNASILLATKLIRDGKADAVVSAGPTGGVVAAAVGVLGTVEGISRPVFGGTILGSLAPRMFAADLGGNVDVRPHQLLDFAIVGTVYMRKMFGIESPTVALLSNGAEEGKGNELTRAAIPLFKQSGLNFIGCVEGHDLVRGTANVIVCDAFVGNIIVKFCEELGKSIIKYIETDLAGKTPVNELKALTEKIFKATNCADSKGGGPLLAVNGIVCKAHGRSRAPEITKIIGEAKNFVQNDFLGALKAEIVLAKSKIKDI
jgi:phosphate acyltransferase